MTADPMSILSVPDCWDLLRADEVGRLAVVIDGVPEIFPVNYVVDHGSIVFRTAEGTKFDAAVLGQTVAFEIDGEADGEAWSVVVKGRAEEIQKMEAVFAAAHLPLYPWNASPKPNFVQILPEQVTGRRFRITDRAAHHADDQVARRASPE